MTRVIVSGPVSRLETDIQGCGRYLTNSVLTCGEHDDNGHHKYCPISLSDVPEEV